MSRIVMLLALMLLAASPLILSRGDAPDIDASFAIRAEPVPLDARNASRDRVGRLRFLGGWELTSDDPDFGGISGMAVDGDDFLAVGDSGGIFRFALDGEGRIRRASIGSLVEGPSPENGGETRKRDRDAESVAIGPDGRSFWVGYERANAVWRYRTADGRATANRAPEAMEDWPNNGGAEALVRLPDGRFLVFSEAGDGPGSSNDALMFAGDPASDGGAPVRFGYRPPEGFRITDAALAGGTRLLILNRRFTFFEGVAVIVTMADLSDIREGAILEGEIIARFAPPLTVDNFEALAVTRESGRTIVWMASDDNFTPLQRTLLMKFELLER